MFYANELHLLRDTFRKCQVLTHVIAPEDNVSRVLYNGMESVLTQNLLVQTTVREYFGTLEPHTVYKMTDSMRLTYIYFLLPGAENENILFIGPYVSATPSSKQILEIGEKNGILPKNQKLFESYFMHIPTLPDNSHLLVLLDAFCERIFGTPHYSVVDFERESRTPYSPINEMRGGDDLDGVLLNMKLMERRYELENELMQAVSLGQENRISSLLVSFSDSAFEKRVADPLRNMKNYCIIMNTLLRKAAESGGVHPIYLDRVSSSFAVKLEQIGTVADITPLMTEMFHSYCRLVRKHSMRDYSPIVQKAIVFIDSELSSNLTLSTLAEVQKVSAGYLSSIFKRETGKTVTEYIREKRIKHAAHLLRTTHLQIQTVALHCGIMDVQYFSKTFKKYMGMTPKEYRESIK